MKKFRLFNEAGQVEQPEVAEKMEKHKGQLLAELQEEMKRFEDDLRKRKGWAIEETIKKLPKEDPERIALENFAAGKGGRIDHPYFAEEMAREEDALRNKISRDVRDFGHDEIRRMNKEQVEKRVAQLLGEIKSFEVVAIRDASYDVGVRFVVGDVVIECTVPRLLMYKNLSVADTKDIRLNGEPLVVQDGVLTVFRIVYHIVDRKLREIGIKQISKTVDASMKKQEREEEKLIERQSAIIRDLEG